MGSSSELPATRCIITAQKAVNKAYYKMPISRAQLECFADARFSYKEYSTMYSMDKPLRTLYLANPIDEPVCIRDNIGLLRKINTTGHGKGLSDIAE